MNKVTISCVGPPPYVEDPATPNERIVERMIERWKRELDQVLPDRPDLIVLPEACDRPVGEGFTWDRQAEYYRYRGNAIRDTLAGIARDNNCYITYPAHIEAADGSWRNAMQLLGRDGEVVGTYHKNHLVPGEHDKYGILYGREAPLLQCDFGTVAGVICFDLNFEQLLLKYKAAKPDILLFPSMYHGGFMQSYWAYSCRSHFAGAIGVGGPPCTVLNPLGEVLATSTNYYHFVTTTVNLDCAVIHLDENLVHFRDMKRKYGKDLIIHDPGRIGAVLLTSESEEFTVKEVIAEFGLELLDDYFDRSLAHRHVSGHMEEV